MATVFLTGSTGFLGGALASLLCEDARVERLLLLVRAETSDDAASRAVRSLARFGVTAASSPRIEVVRGDLASFTLLPEQLERITHVVHAAAHTSFRSTRRAWITNVDETNRLGEMLSAARGLQRFLYVGTAYRCGMVDAVSVDEEMAIDRHLNEYTRSKAAAEERLRDLPLMVARPSVIAGHSRLGIGPSASLYWYYRALAEAGVSPFKPEQKRDIVPVDWAAEALRKLLFLETPKHTAYHLSAGENAESWRQICQRFAALGIGDDKTRSVDANALAESEEIRALGLSDRARAAMAAIAGFAALRVESFVNQRMRSAGIAPPPRFSEVLGACVASDRRTLDELTADDL